MNEVVGRSEHNAVGGQATISHQHFTSPPPPISSAVGWSGNKMVRTHRSPSVMKAAEVAQIPHVPVILFIGLTFDVKTCKEYGPNNAMRTRPIGVCTSAKPKINTHYANAGGPGGGKTRHAARIANTLADQGLAHICMPDVIRNALLKYKERYSEWKAANDCYLRGWFTPFDL
ncbi:unnamed protein product [Haemonchus placei]|uniref:Uncharacterized protein n=1 Tax=Haemonchus placei TaxID=6290 RepID=A0A3P7T918_HAEPC|nr:unnamed protein product [Haemonchus placei]